MSTSPEALAALAELAEHRADPDFWRRRAVESRRLAAETLAAADRLQDQAAQTQAARDAKRAANRQWIAEQNRLTEAAIAARDPHGHRFTHADRQRARRRRREAAAYEWRQRSSPGAWRDFPPQPTWWVATKTIFWAAVVIGWLAYHT
jgi:hypothetical protein